MFHESFDLDHLVRKNNRNMIFKKHFFKAKRDANLRVVDIILRNHS